MFQLDALCLADDCLLPFLGFLEGAMKLLGLIIVLTFEICYLTNDDRSLSISGGVLSLFAYN